ncbi:hypothetical protein EZS27_009357 [termite gut metagenome]|uniref:Uncharacterized protein n=1 Tax=termite gut metagenome TaxID=433724 RepID=A0A5J4SA21_9ZZZZ
MSAPVKHTCPDIDKLIEKVREVLKLKPDLSSEEIISEINYHLWGFEDKLNELRYSNDELRKWGEGLEDELKESEAKIEALEARIEELEEMITANLIN